MPAPGGSSPPACGSCSDTARGRKAPMELIRPSRRDLLELGGAGAALALIGASAAPDAPWQRAARIVRTVRAPIFSPRRFDITAFGARGDGTTKNSAALARAIEACHADGGGRVVVPPGRFLTGAVTLKSQVELHLMAGATLLFSTDPADYPLVPTRWEGIELINYSPLIYAYGARDIAITGQGTLDGQASASAWWSWKGPWGGTIDHGWRAGMPNQRPARARLADLA